jgi:hypothetical protein
LFDGGESYQVIVQIEHCLGTAAGGRFFHATDLIGRSIEIEFGLLPEKWKKTVGSATKRALQKKALQRKVSYGVGRKRPPVISFIYPVTTTSGGGDPSLPSLQEYSMAI